MHCGWYYTSVYEIQNTYSQNSWGAKREKIMVTAPILELKSPSSMNELGLGWTELCNDSTYAFSIPLWPLLLLCKVKAKATGQSNSNVRKRCWEQAVAAGLAQRWAPFSSSTRGQHCSWHPITYGSCLLQGTVAPKCSLSPGRTLWRHSRNVLFRICMEISFSSTLFFF